MLFDPALTIPFICFSIFNIVSIAMAYYLDRKRKTRIPTSAIIFIVSISLVPYANAVMTAGIIGGWLTFIQTTREKS